MTGEGRVVQGGCMNKSRALAIRTTFVTEGDFLCGPQFISSKDI